MAIYRSDTGLRIAKPEKYVGIKGILKPWLLMMNINFKIYLKMFSDERSKVLFVISYLEGAALD